jgi:ubiquinone/menaquinone biosynthesis C-methylase UbiE
MLGEEYFRLWSMLRLYAQENGYNERRNIVERQLDDLIERAKPREADKGSVEIDPNFEVPPYQKSLDIHWMPGSYYTETTKDDVSAGAMYDAGGLYLSTYGMLGKYNNGAGYAVATWIKENYPHINPKRILDQGCTVGSNTLPYKDAWPDADVIGIDIGGPCLRYGHRRAESLGFDVTFSQQNAEQTKYEDGSFDMVLSTMFLHETSNRAVHNIVAENYRLLKPGGLMLHVEHPFEELMKDWDTHNNNEPFWGTMHDMDLEDVALRAGFKKDNIVQTFADQIRPTDEDTYSPGAGQWFIYAATK